MGSTLLTVDMITREALRILHQKCNFIGSINRQYDDRFQQGGAQIGDSLRIRKPVKVVTRTGRVINTQDTTEKKVDLTVDNQIGVDVTFTSKELTLELDEFSRQILEPSMAQLAATIESTVISNLYKDVYQEVDNAGSSGTFANTLNVRKKLVDALTPMDDQMAFRMDTQLNVDLVDALKGLFQSSDQIKKQYMQGVLGRTAGFEWAENTFMPSHTVGSQDGSYQTKGGSQTGSTLNIDQGSGTIKNGDIFTIAGVNRVHPETKADTGVLQSFVVTADEDTGGDCTISFAPEIIASGAYQNVSNAAGDNKSLTFHGTASTAHNVSMGYHKDAFTFATADLVMPDGVDFASRQVYDGISLRIVRQYDITNDMFPCRIDVLYGYLATRPELACRLAAN